jgi:peroxiredoxin
MKKIVLMLMAIIPATVYAQKVADNFNIKAKVGTLSQPAKAYLGYLIAGKDFVDSSAIVNGAFSFHGHVNGPENATIVIDAKGLGLSHLSRNLDILNFYVEKGNIVITSADSVAKATIAGSKVNADNKRLGEALKPYYDAEKAVLAEAGAASDAQKLNPYFANTIQRKYKLALIDEQEGLRKFVAQNPGSFISLAAIGTLDQPDADQFAIEKMFNTLSPEVKATEAGIAFHNTLETAKKTAIGSIAPEFTQADTSGKAIALSSLRGKYILVDFWASWCIPCRVEHRATIKTYAAFKDKNFTILGVSLEKPGERANWLKAIKDDGMTWPQVSDLKYHDNQVAILYNVAFIPQNYLLDPTGKIIAKNLHGEELAAKLAEVLK